MTKLDDNKNETNTLRQRKLSNTSLPSLSNTSRQSSFSDIQIRKCDTNSALLSTSSAKSKAPPQHDLKRALSAIASPHRRLSRQSSLPWGHKPSPLVGASCILFILPVPFMLRSCFHFNALMLFCVTISSFMSDHAYTGLDSWAHAVDRLLAPIAFATTVWSAYSVGGLKWALSSVLPIACHVLSHYNAKRGNYEQFVIWHSLWHAFGVAFAVTCFALNGGAGTCYAGRVWEDSFKSLPFF